MPSRIRDEARLSRDGAWNVHHHPRPTLKKVDFRNQPTSAPVGGGKSFRILSAHFHRIIPRHGIIQSITSTLNKGRSDEEGVAELELALTR